jgi:hypothetical protein
LAVDEAFGEIGWAKGVVPDTRLLGNGDDEMTCVGWREEWEGLGCCCGHDKVGNLIQFHQNHAVADEENQVGKETMG